MDDPAHLTTDDHAGALAELAVRATQLAHDIRAAQVELRALSEEVVARTGFRLDDAAGQADGVGAALLDTAHDLRRIGARTDRTCAAEWGACPVHGATLTSSGGQAWCTAHACELRWDYDRLGLPCSEDAVAFVTFMVEHKETRVCQGHLAHLDKQAIAAGTVKVRRIRAEETP
jgi:hypothetical protein